MTLERPPANVLGLFGSIAAGVIHSLAKDNILLMVVISTLHKLELMTLSVID